ncbi:MAG: hypothetical protein K2K28_03720 [Clostridia bacterium]|nr:hypothetical protein [Clostridia bacterium]
MENKNKRCYRCKHFQRYYTKGTKKFDQTKYGRCCEKSDTVSSCDTCDKWKGKSSYKYIKWAAQKALNDILIDIKAIRQVIEEAQKDEKM